MYIKVDIDKLSGFGNTVSSVRRSTGNIKSSFYHTGNSLDWDVKAASGINRTISQINNELENQMDGLRRMESFFDMAGRKYSEADRQRVKGDMGGRFSPVPVIIIRLGPGRRLNPLINLILNNNVIKLIHRILIGNDIRLISYNIMERIVPAVSIASLSPMGVMPVAIWKDVISHIFNDIGKGEDILSEVEKILGYFDALGEIGELGIFENITDFASYITSLLTFFTGDKKGFTGASDLFNMADSSVKVWSGLYDYFYDKYSNLNSGLFGDVAKRNVKILGVAGGFFGLIASVFSASDGLGDKKWQSIVADYVDSGNDIISIIKSGYELKNIGNIKSLAEIKVGPLSALTIYMSIAEAVVQSVSQGFRSHEKYYADGHWDLGDTGAMGIDVSMAGFYGLANGLTFGLADLVFGARDKASGGDGNSDMSYIEKAAEGYKILGKKIGESIGNWWVSLTR